MCGAQKQDLSALDNTTERLSVLLADLATDSRFAFLRPQCEACLKVLDALAKSELWSQMVLTRSVLRSTRVLARSALRSKRALTRSVLRGPKGY